MLFIYTEASNPASVLSEDGAFTAPLFIGQDGRAGGVTEKKLWVRNDGTPSGKWYDAVTVTPVDTAGGSVVDGTDGYSWKLKAGDTQPTPAEWSLVVAGDPISLADIGGPGSEDTSSYRPFWVRVEIPKNAPVSTFTDVQLWVDSDQQNV